MKYFISDLHLGHKKILEYDKRPFSSVKEMKEVIFENWQNTVTNKDDVYLLGDCAMNREDWEDLLKLKGRKHMIMGNHDKIPMDMKREFASINSYSVVKENGKVLVLSHFPIASWNGMTHGSIHLYGHVHRGHEMDILVNIKDKFEKHFNLPFNAFNVGCMIDYMDYTPRTIDELFSFYKERSLEEIIKDNMING